ncbi:MAG: hypothetical protein DYG89_23990 [Caldilinea sp. CFX5]|nr:hypothetical protein [Caldilinea sp. CFX5]
MNDGTIIAAVCPDAAFEQVSASQLVNELNRLGVYFLQGETAPLLPAAMTPASLVMQLATSEEARLRLALIPLLLRHPLLAADVGRLVAQLPLSAQVVLKCYYTAAHLLQQKYCVRLQALFGDMQRLPDLFTGDLELPTFTHPEQGLQWLAERQRTLSGRAINWLGTYEHGAQRLLTHYERRQSWRRSQSVKSLPY